MKDSNLELEYYTRLTVDNKKTRSDLNGSISIFYASSFRQA